MKHSILIILLVPGLISCLNPNPNADSAGDDLLYDKQVFVSDVDLSMRDTVYVPIYSEIYSETKNLRFNLTATLSIRNTSPYDSIFVEEIDYYDTKGTRVRRYLEQTLVLVPMQSIEYVIEQEDTSGGTGANFLIRWGAKSKNLKPVFQGVMISTYGQQGISFTTDGVSVSRN